MNEEFLKRAKELAAKAMDKVSTETITADDVYIVWFCKTLQNWKALVSTDKVNVNDYVEVTHNGDKAETYVDVYTKSINRVYPDKQPE